MEQNEKTRQLVKTVGGEQAECREIHMMLEEKEQRMANEIAAQDNDWQRAQEVETGGLTSAVVTSAEAVDFLEEGGQVPEQKMIPLPAISHSQECDSAKEQRAMERGTQLNENVAEVLNFKRDGLKLSSDTQTPSDAPQDWVADANGGNRCPSTSDLMLANIKSKDETPHPQAPGGMICEVPDADPSEEKGGRVVRPVMCMSDVSVEDSIKKDVSIDPTTLLQESLENSYNEAIKERCIDKEKGEDADITSETLRQTAPPAGTILHTSMESEYGEADHSLLKGKPEFNLLGAEKTSQECHAVNFQPTEPKCSESEISAHLESKEVNENLRDSCCLESVPPKHKDSKTEMPLPVVMKVEKDGEVSLEPKIKRRRKSSCPVKKGQKKNASVEYAVVCSLDQDSLQSATAAGVPDCSFSEEHATETSCQAFTGEKLSETGHCDGKQKGKSGRYSISKVLHQDESVVKIIESPVEHRAETVMSPWHQLTCAEPQESTQNVDFKALAVSKEMHPIFGKSRCSRKTKKGAKCMKEGGQACDNFHEQQSGCISQQAQLLNPETTDPGAIFQNSTLNVNDKKNGKQDRSQISVEQGVEVAQETLQAIIPDTDGCLIAPKQGLETLNVSTGLDQELPEKQHEKKEQEQAESPEVQVRANVEVGECTDAGEGLKGLKYSSTENFRHHNSKTHKARKRREKVKRLELPEPNIRRCSLESGVAEVETMEGHLAPDLDQTVVLASANHSDSPVPETMKSQSPPACLLPEDSSELKASDVVEQKPRKRGRPPKVTADIAANTSDLLCLTPRKRGRPRKVVIKKEEDDPQEVEPLINSSGYSFEQQNHTVSQQAVVPPSDSTNSEGTSIVSLKKRISKKKKSKVAPVISPERLVESAGQSADNPDPICSLVLPQQDGCEMISNYTQVDEGVRSKKKKIKKIKEEIIDATSVGDGDIKGPLAGSHSCKVKKEGKMLKQALHPQVTHLRRSSQVSKLATTEKTEDCFPHGLDQVSLAGTSALQNSLFDSKKALSSSQTGISVPEVSGKHEASNSVEQVPCRRGRPPKKKQVSDKDEGAQDLMVTDHKDEVAGNPNNLLSCSPRKRGRPRKEVVKNEADETQESVSLTLNSSGHSFEQQSHTISQKALVPSSGKTDCEGTSILSVKKRTKKQKKKKPRISPEILVDSAGRNVDTESPICSNSVVISQQSPCEMTNTFTHDKAEHSKKKKMKPVKEEKVETTSLVGEQRDSLEVLTALETNEAVPKFKGKRGRPFKKKTLIRLLKQVPFSEEQRSHELGESAVHEIKYDTVHQDFPSLQTNRCNVKKEGKKKRVTLTPSMTQLRRYSRACKLSSVEKMKDPLGNNLGQTVSLAMSGPTDHHLFAKANISPSPSVVERVFETNDSSERKLGGPPKKQESQKVNVKDEGGQESSSTVHEDEAQDKNASPAVGLDASVSNSSVFSTPRKRGRPRKRVLKEESYDSQESVPLIVKDMSYSFEQLSDNVSQQEEKIEAISVVGERRETQKAFLGLKSCGIVKLKRKNRRRSKTKKKTFIKMTKRLVCTEKQESKGVGVYPGNPLENDTVNQDIPSHQPQGCTGMKVSKKVKVANSPETLRRYSRACKITPDYTVSKMKDYNAHNLDVLPAMSAPTDHHLFAKTYISSSPSVVDSVFETSDSSERKLCKLGGPPKKQESQKVNVKDEGGQESSSTVHEDEAQDKHASPAVGLDASVSNSSVFSTPRKRGRPRKQVLKEESYDSQESMPLIDKDTSYSFEQLSDNVSQREEKLEAASVVGECGETQEAFLGLKSCGIVKLKRKNRRRSKTKKKTFIKMAKQLLCTEKQESKVMGIYPGNALENDTVNQDMPSRQPQGCTGMKVSKKVKVANPPVTLRRYGRACKITPDYTVSKMKDYNVHNLDVLPASSDPSDSLSLSLHLQTKQEVEGSTEMAKPSETVGYSCPNTSKMRKLESNFLLNSPGEAKVLESTASFNTSLDTAVTPLQGTVTESGVLSAPEKPRKMIGGRMRKRRRRAKGNGKRKEKAVLWKKQVTALVPEGLGTEETSVGIKIPEEQTPESSITLSINEVIHFRENSEDEPRDMSGVNDCSVLPENETGRENSLEIGQSANEKNDFDVQKLLNTFEVLQAAMESQTEEEIKSLQSETKLDLVVSKEFEALDSVQMECSEMFITKNVSSEEVLPNSDLEMAMRKESQEISQLVSGHHNQSNIPQDKTVLKLSTGDVEGEELLTVTGDVRVEKSITEMIEPPVPAACSSKGSVVKLAVTQEAKGKQEEEIGGLFEDAEGQVSNQEKCSVEKVTEELNLTTLLSKRQVPRKSSKKGRNHTVCHFCGRSFRHFSAYITHRRIHTGEKPYRCHECGKNFAQLSDLRAHRNVHRLPGYLQCPLCTSRFSSKDKLLAHILVHIDSNQQMLNQKLGSDAAGKKTQTGVDLLGSTSSVNDQRPLKCLDCGKSFSTSGALKVHMRTHRGERPFSCKVCGKAFSQVNNLSDHEKIHWQVKPYACSVCGKGFSRLTELKTHSRTHTGEKPFTCAGCGQAFHQLSALRTHQTSKVCLTKAVGDAASSSIKDFLVLHGLEMQENPAATFECQICSTRYNLPSEYELHLLTHTDVQTDFCDADGRQCNQSSDGNAQVSSRLIEDESNNTSLSEVPITSQNQTGHLPHQQETLPLSNQQSQCKVLPAAQLQIIQHSPNPQLKSSNSTQMPVAETCQPSCNDSKQNSTTSKRYICRHCGQLFKYPKRLQAHTLTHNPCYSYTCGHCGKILKNWNKYWLHQKVHRQKPSCFCCPQCGQHFLFPGLYKDHMQEHAKQNPYACPLCPEIFCSEQNLRDHQRDEHKVCKSHKCHICGKGFIDQGNFERHGLRHRGTRPRRHLQRTYTNSHSLSLPEVPAEPLLLTQKCGECHASFASLDLLRTHQLCHSTGEREQQSDVVMNKTVSGSLLPQQLQPQPTPPPTPITPPPPALSPAPTPQCDNLYDYPHPDALYVYPTPSTAIPPPILPSLPVGVHPKMSQITSRNTYPNVIFKASSSRTVSVQHDHSYMLHRSTSRSAAVSVSVSHPVKCQTPAQTSRLVQRSTPRPSFYHPQGQASLNLQIQQQTLRYDGKSKAGVSRASSSFVKLKKKQEEQESVECAECGTKFGVVSDLYDHYIQHARGEL